MTESRLLRAIRAVVREIFADYAYRCPYRYRVVSMSGDRVMLQAINKSLGIPDIIPIEVRPGAAGFSANLTPGCEVLVQFIEGNVSMPYIAAFTPKGNPGHAPEDVTLDATTMVNLGGSGGSALAHASDVQSALNQIVASLNVIIPLVAPPGGVGGTPVVTLPNVTPLPPLIPILVYSAGPTTKTKAV